MKNSEHIRTSLSNNVGIALLFSVMVFYTVITATFNVVRYFEPDTFTVSLSGPVEDYKGLKVGENFTFERTICIEKDLLIHVNREILSLDTMEKYLLPSLNYLAAYDVDTPCYNINFVTKLPTMLKPGEYYYEPTLSYRINASKRISKAAPGVYFEVVE